MKSKYFPEFRVQDLTPSEDNPRFIKTDKFKKLVKSVSDFPEMLKIRPVVATADGSKYPFRIIAGNMRFQAAKYLNFRTIPTIVVSEISVKKQREFAIKDNVSAGFWDFEKLSNDFEIDDLQTWGLTIPDFDQPGSADDDDDGVFDLDDKRNNFVKIKFFPEHIKEARKILEFWGNRGLYVGGYLIEQLKQFDENNF